ncbi:hypothetical protein [Undibacterium sp. Di24W]|uniref:hypothetical protein n=1 Tax=Undibacterium sp. Di24W TaxID=3413033 RepID=UPI003BF290D4
MRKISQLLLSCTILFFTCVVPSNANAQIRREEVEAYAALLNHLSIEYASQASIIIRSKTTDLSPHILSNSVSEIKRLLPEATEYVITDLLHADKQQSNFEIPVRFVRSELKFAMLSQQTYFDIFSESRTLEESWKLFYSRYPKTTGLFSFSRAGIDLEKKQVLFTYARSAGGRAGSGYLVLMQQKWWRWEVARIANIWIS